MVNHPTFTFSGASDSLSGVDGYYVYWGSSASGTSNNYQNITSYDGGIVTTGTYYLRVSTKDTAGNQAAWATVFSFIYTLDNTPPINPTEVSETHSVPNGIWQSTVNSPNFTWSGAADPGGSGVAGYNVYWGMDPAGTTGTYQTSSSYVPGAVTSGTYYLRIQTKDNAGNMATWVTSFTFLYDSLLPANPTTVNETHGAPNDIWQSTVSSPSFTWIGAADPGGSGVAGYNVYWGTDPAGTTGTHQTTNNYSPGTVTSGTYYLRIQTKDNAGNISAWATSFTFMYDGIAPTNPTAMEDHEVVNNTDQYLVNHPTFTFSGASDSLSGVDGYYVYWGSSGIGTSTGYQTTTSFDPGTVTPGTYYLRISTKDKAGNQSDWTTVFTFIYAADIPSITNATPQGGFTPNWTGSSGPITFSWQQVSGVSSYKIFISVVGSPKDYETPVTCTTSTCTYTPSANFPYFDSGFWQIASIVGNVEHWSDRISFYPNKPQ